MLQPQVQPAQPPSALAQTLPTLHDRNVDQTYRVVGLYPGAKVTLHCCYTAAQGLGQQCGGFDRHFCQSSPSPSLRLSVAAAFASCRCELVEGVPVQMAVVQAEAGA